MASAIVDHVLAQFKKWVDAVTRANVTFHYMARGPEGLAIGAEAANDALAEAQRPVDEALAA